MSKAQYLDKSVYNKLYPYMMYSNALALRIALETGLRIDDVLSLRRPNLIGNKLYYRAQKTGKEGVATISSRLADELFNLPCGGKNAYFFPKRGKKTGHRTRQAVYSDMEKALSRAHVETHASPHSSRKTFAVDLYRKTGDINAVKKALQHSDTSTTSIYAFADHAATDNCFGCFMANLPQIAHEIARLVAEELKKCQSS